MFTRRGVLLSSIAGAVVLSNRFAVGKAAQPATPVNFQVPADACDCHTHIHGDPEKFPFLQAASTRRNWRRRRKWRRCTRHSASSAW